MLFSYCQLSYSGSDWGWCARRAWDSWVACHAGRAGSNTTGTVAVGPLGRWILLVLKGWPEAAAVPQASRPWPPCIQFFLKNLHVFLLLSRNQYMLWTAVAFSGHGHRAALAGVQKTLEPSGCQAHLTLSWQLPNCGDFCFAQLLIFVDRTSHGYCTHRTRTRPGMNFSDHLFCIGLAFARCPFLPRDSKGPLASGCVPGHNGTFAVQLNQNPLSNPISDGYRVS